MGSACTAERSSTMSGCCPEGSYGNPPFPGYSWNDKGVVDQVGDMKMYRTGCSPKCIIWCHDIYGFEGGRPRQLCDQLADTGYMVIMPDFFRGEWRDVSAADLGSWLVSLTGMARDRLTGWRPSCPMPGHRGPRCLAV